MNLRHLKTNTSGSLYLHSMPGRYETIGQFIATAEELGISLVICLNSDEEIQLKSPDYYQALRSSRFPVKRKAFPIIDFGVADNTEAFYALVRYTARLLTGGTNILVHCAGGIGRTGTFAGCMLKALELPLTILESCGSYPETDEQMELIIRFDVKTTQWSKSLRRLASGMDIANDSGLHEG